MISWPSSARPNSRSIRSQEALDRRERPSRRTAESHRVRPCLEGLEGRILFTTFVYTESNDADGNAVIAFRENANGSLSEIGSFNTSGFGQSNIPPLIGPNDSSFAVITSPDNRFLFAVNQGSTSVSSFRINGNGGLQRIGTFNSGGAQPDSLAITGDFLYVTNRGNSAFNGGSGTFFPGDDVPNITAFKIAGDGKLTPIPGGTVPLDLQSSPSHSLITPDGKLLLLDNFAVPGGATEAQGGNTMIPFRIAADGKLVPVASGPVGAPAGSPPPLLLGAELNPNARIIYGGLALRNEVAVFTYDASGNITFVGENSPVSGTVPCWADISADGKFLYTGNSNSDSVGVFSLADPMHPVEIQEFALGGPLAPPGSPPGALQVRVFQVQLSPDGESLYAISAANAPPGSLFPNGNQVHDLTVNPVTGMVSEPTAPFLLDTVGVPGHAAPQGVAVITVAPPTLSINDKSLSEGNSGTKNATFTVTRTGDTSGVSTVKFTTANGTASSGSDYIAKSGTLTFAAGQSSRTVTVQVKGDTAVEANETFFVKLSSATGATIADGRGKGTIVNDDAAPPPAVIVGVNDESDFEGNSGLRPITFKVRLDKASTKTVRVKYNTSNGTATAGSDYNAASGTITFAAGQTLKTVTVFVKGDKVKEADETFFLNLTSPINASLGIARGVGRIRNDD